MWLSVGVLGLAVLAGFVANLSRHIDDASIIFRIVRNLLEGHGWVFNVGEQYNASTSVLNTVLIATLARPVGSIPLAAHLIGLAGVLAATFATWDLLSRRFFGVVGLAGGYAVATTLGQAPTWGLEPTCSLG